MRRNARGKPEHLALGRDAPALSKVGAGTFQEESPVAESGARRIARRYVDGLVVASLLIEVQFLTGIFLLAGLTWFNVFGKGSTIHGWPCLHRL